MPGTVVSLGIRWRINQVRPCPHVALSSVGKGRTGFKQILFIIVKHLQYLNILNEGKTNGVLEDEVQST